MVKKILLDILDHLRYQIINDKCTIEELRSITHALVDNLDVDASISDIAEFYGKKETNVRNLCSRRMVSKPKRRVYYNFADIVKIIPKSWLR